MNEAQIAKIIENLGFVLHELKVQSAKPTLGFLSHEQSMKDSDEYINYANEYGIAYEIMIGILESEPVKVSGLAAVKMLEVTLLLGYKTEKEEDRIFDLRAGKKKETGTNVATNAGEMPT